MAWKDTRSCLNWDVDSDVNCSKWIESADTDLPKDLNNIFEGPNYILPKEVGENSIMNTSYKRNIISAGHHHRD